VPVKEDEVVEQYFGDTIDNCIHHFFASMILACNLHASWKGFPLIIHSSNRWVRLEKKKPSFSSGKYRIPACSPFSTMVFVSFSLRAISALKGKESKIDALTFVRMDAVLVCFRKDLSFR
jgi:hypothetical protein